MDYWSDMFKVYYGRSKPGTKNETPSLLLGKKDPLVHSFASQSEAAEAARADRQVEPPPSAGAALLVLL